MNDIIFFLKNDTIASGNGPEQEKKILILMALVGIALADAAALPQQKNQNQERERLVSGLIVQGPFITMTVVNTINNG